MLDQDAGTTGPGRLADKLARVEGALATQWWRPRVGHDLDETLQAHSQAADLQSTRFWLGILAAAQVLGLLRDFSFGVEQTGLLLRGLLVVPLGLAVIYALGRTLSRRTAEAMTSIAILSSLAVQIAMSHVAPAYWADRYLMAAVFSFSILHLVMPLTHRQILVHTGVVAAALVVSIQVGATQRAGLVSDRLDIVLPGVLLLAAIGGLMTRHNRRRAFLMDLRSSLQSEALSDANRALGKLLRQDTLTGVFNRRYFDETMARLWQDLARAGRPLGLILIDVDRFKSFNDRKGHQAGDSCLKQVSARLSSSLRENDFVVARYGGEEFAVILPGASASEAQAVGERLRRAVQDMALPHPAGGLVTVSVGTAACLPDTSAEFYTLVDAADRGLYASKEAGRNCVTASFAPVEAQDPPVIMARVA